MTKRCALCGREKPVEDFYFKGESTTGQPIYAAQCRPCALRYQRAYNRRNAVARRAAWREYQRDRLQNPTIREHERQRQRRRWEEIKADDEKHERKKAADRERMRRIYAAAKETLG